MIRFRLFNSYLRRSDRLEVMAGQIADYASVGRALLMQRIGIFGAALTLQAAYVSVQYAVICATLIFLTEFFENRTFRLIEQMDHSDPKQVRHMLHRIVLGTIAGTGVIGLFTISVSVLISESNYFMPLFFLLAAGIFAAMNNHQIVTVLLIRLVGYGGIFLFIPLWNLLKSGAPLSDPAWMNFFTSLFVVYFIIDCSISALSQYRDSKRHHRELQIENARARAALVAKTEFLSTVSHELRTPLTSIKAALEMSTAGAFGPLPGKSAGVLGIAQRNATRLNKLINELLDMQKMEVGKISFECTDVQVSSLLADAVADNTAYAQELGVELQLDPVDADLYIHADRQRIEQVVANLVSNAAKFSPSGSTVWLSATCQDQRLRINVKDRGMGVPDADRARIFDSFTQLDSSDKRAVGGTGLGLHISRRIAQAHNGDIAVEANKDGPGSTFHLTLDRVDAPQVGSADPADDTMENDTDAAVSARLTA